MFIAYKPRVVGHKTQQEVESCKVNGLSFCIWYESGQYHVEDMDANKFLILPVSHLCWFMGSISELLRGSSNRFFLRNGCDVMTQGDKALKIQSFF